jgi:hypothetical protein
LIPRDSPFGNLGAFFPTNGEKTCAQAGFVIAEEREVWAASSEEVLELAYNFKYEDALLGFILSCNSGRDIQDYDRVTRVHGLELRQAFAVVSQCDVVLAPDSSFIHQMPCNRRPPQSMHGGYRSTESCADHFKGD